MSDYVHNKVVRMKFPQSILSKCKTDDAFDCYTYLKEKLGDLFDKGIGSFQIQWGEATPYLDYVIYHTYGEESGDWGIIRMLSDKEYTLISIKILKLGELVLKSDLRYVDYCYYNCSEAPDYFDLPNNDESDLVTFMKNR